MRDHVSWRRSIQFEAKRRGANSLERSFDPGFVFAHRLFVWHSGERVVVLMYSKTAIVLHVENLHLRPAASVCAKDVEVGITREFVEWRIELFAIADRAARAQIKRNGSGHRKAASDRWINRGIDRGRPPAT